MKKENRNKGGDLFLLIIFGLLAIYLYSLAGK